MESYLSTLSKEEITSLNLSALFEGFGYRKYRNTRFEEYSFYHDYQGFLAGEGVIAFNNAEGRLMALKPDMTLSILKNVEINPRSFSRIYYNENVYRFQQSTREYKEIHQCGLEMIGPMDDVAVGEVVLLALQSLEQIDARYVLTLSHAHLVANALQAMPVEGEVRRQMAECMRKKNLHDLGTLTREEGFSEEVTRALAALAGISVPIRRAEEVLMPLHSVLFAGDEACGNEYARAVEELRNLHTIFAGTPYADHLQLDTSVINPVDYYSGIVMQGYVQAVPMLVLAGGRYDRLAEKLRKEVGAMGFAVYLDRLQAYYKTPRPYDVDTLVLYTEDTPPGELLQKCRELQGRNRSVRMEKRIPVHMKAKNVLRYADGTWEERNV